MRVGALGQAAILGGDAVANVCRGRVDREVVRHLTAGDKPTDMRGDFDSHRHVLRGSKIGECQLKKHRAF